MIDIEKALEWADRIKQERENSKGGWTGLTSDFHCIALADEVINLRDIIKSKADKCIYCSDSEERTQRLESKVSKALYIADETTGDWYTPTMRVLAAEVRRLRTSLSEAEKRAKEQEVKLFYHMDKRDEAQVKWGDWMVRAHKAEEKVKEQDERIKELEAKLDEWRRSYAR